MRAAAERPFDMQPHASDVAANVEALLRAAHAACGEPLAHSDFDGAAFEAAVGAGDLRGALDLADAIADENDVPEMYWASMLAAARLLSEAGHGDLGGNVQYYENGLDLVRAAGRAA